MPPLYRRERAVPPDDGPVDGKVGLRVYLSPGCPAVDRLVASPPDDSAGSPGREIPSMSLLPDAEAFKRLIDGSSRGFVPSAARAVLAAVAAPYGLVVASRNAAYDRGLLPVHRAPVPVVSVGNLTLGGTGKTPLVAWLARELATRGLDAAIVSRGYGASGGTTSDEAAELAVVLPGVRHIADRDRVAAAGAAAAAGADIVVLDDGFQHRRLARTVDIVTIDATDPWGSNRLFPRGLLRERISGLSRADAVVLTRASSVDADRRATIRTAADRACHGRSPAVWVEADHLPLQLRSSAGQTFPLAPMAGRRVAAFAGIGNPAAFRTAVAGLAAACLGFRPFPDHHAYTEEDLQSVGAWAAACGAEWVLTTLKDLVKVNREHLAGLPLFAVEIALQIQPGDGLDALGNLLDDVARTAAAGRRP